MLRRLALLALALCAIAAAKPDDAVRWHTWGAEAFAKARSEDKPIFLNIGYASCHWCHVMERESFQDPTLAALINERFVPIHVDRNEHPDVDAIYTAFIAAMNNGNSGWPANLVITSDLSPIAGATYLTNEALRASLRTIDEKWRTDRASLLQNGAAVLAAARTGAQESSPLDAASPRVGQALLQRLREWHDRENGGFGTAPKFPQPFYLDFLLRRWQLLGDDVARDMAIKSLDGILRGAIHDQVAGGFHRYAVDAEWRKPHYEKMLPDQAVLAMLYLEAWQITKRDDYARAARRTLDYALRMLEAKSGTFVAGEDSDSLLPVNGAPVAVEGGQYLWRRDELTPLLGKDANLMAYYFGLAGKTPRVLYVAHSDAETQKQFGLTKEQFAQKLDAALARMLIVQSHRPSPKIDNTVITSWNALMVSALARAGAALDDDHYRYAANNAMRAVEARKFSHAPGVPAFAEDYAFMVQAYLDLFDATSNATWLTRAVALQEQQDALLWNGTTLRYDGGSALPPALRGAMLERDGDLPSANSVSASNLLRIAALTDSKPARAKAEAIFRSFAVRMQNAPGDLPLLIATFNAARRPPREVVIVGDVTRDDTKAMIRLVHEQFAPLRVFLVVPNERARDELSAFAPFIKEMKSIDEKLPTAFVCQNYSCKPPTTDIEKLGGMLSVVDAEVGEK